jgi:predicted AlkP superfamily phosphohydrolase/phosphomutase
MTRTVLIGLDAATFTVLDPLMDAGVMPFLRSFRQAGTSAELISTANPLTAAAWPSIMTGISPGNHGIFDFVHFHKNHQGAYFKLTNSTDLDAETVWSIASRQGRTVTALNFYAMWPPRPVAGYTMSGFVTWKHMKSAVYPPSLYTQLQGLPNVNRKELAKDIDVERLCVQGMPPEKYREWILLYIRKEIQWFETLRYLMTSDPSDLVAIVFEGVDKIQHLCWRLLDPALIPRHPSAWEAEIHRLCLEYFRRIDHFLEQIVTLAGPQAQVFIVSDHGFGTSTEIFYVNAWLHERGYLEWTDTARPDTAENLTSDRLADNMSQLDWSKTRAYAITSSSNGIFVETSGPGCSAGVTPEDYEGFRRRLSDELLAYRSPFDGGQVITQVRSREEAYPGRHMSRAPDLLLTLRDGGFVSVLDAPSPLKLRTEAVGTHRMEGIFVAGGPGIAHCGQIAPLSLLDIAPLLLYSLDLPVPEDLEGRLPEEIFETAYRKAHPYRYGPPTVLPEQGGPGREDYASQSLTVEPPGEDERLILERLKALGYLE